MGLVGGISEGHRGGGYPSVWETMTLIVVKGTLTTVLIAGVFLSLIVRVSQLGGKPLWFEDKGIAESTPSRHSR
jgi:hypothetical protein